jgi:F-type H+-transporting ATPase subunit delta
LIASTLQAKRFSQAIFEIAKEKNEFEKWQSDIQQLAALARNPEFLAVMENPKFPFETKKRLLDVQAKSISNLARNLSYLLTSQEKFGLITEIFTSYQELWDEYRGVEKAEVITAVQMDDKEKTKLKDYLSRITGKNIVLTIKVDPSIIGGMIARVGGKIIDGSTSNQLNTLKNELANAGR